MKFVIVLAALVAVALGKEPRTKRNLEIPNGTIRILFNHLWLHFSNHSIFCSNPTAQPTTRPARPTPAKGDFRNEFDHLLVATATQRFHELEDFLLKLSEQVADLEKTHNKEEKARIVREISAALTFTSGSHGFFERELKRTDLDLVEKFNFEAALATAQVLNKDLSALATRVNAIKA